MSMSEARYEGLRLEHQLCFPLYACSRMVIKKYCPFLDAINLTYTQYITMMVLWEEDCISVRDLGNRLFLDSGTLTPLLKSLEAKGFLRRYRSQEDERVLLVQLTEEGLALREAAADVPAQIAGCIALSPEEAQALYGILYKLLLGSDTTDE